MDNMDRKILAELQKDGRLSLTDLAERSTLVSRRATAAYARWSSPVRSAVTGHSLTPTHWA